MDINLNVNVSAPAVSQLADNLGKLIGMLCQQRIEAAPVAPAAEPAPVVEEPAPEKPVKRTRAKKAEPVQEVPAEAPETAPAAVEEPKAEEPAAEPETAPAPEAEPEKHYTIQEVSMAAMQLKDADPENLVKIKALFPQFGIGGRRDLRDDQDKLDYFAQYLKDMGAEL